MEAEDKNDKKQIYKAPVSIFDAIRSWRSEREKQLKQENKAPNGSGQQEDKPKKEYTFPSEIF